MIVPVLKRRHRAILASAVTLSVALLAPQAQAAEEGSRATSPGDALQVIADVTLIDGTCKGLTVDFGMVFRFAALQGVAMSTVMPTGSKRGEFERVMLVRQASFDREELCGQVAGNYAEALPGSIRGSVGRGSGRP